MVSRNQNTNKKKKSIKETFLGIGGKKSGWERIYGMFHCVACIFAMFISFRCNGGFDPTAALFACCCPFIYIVYIGATKGFKFCLSKKCWPTNPYVQMQDSQGGQKYGVECIKQSYSQMPGSSYQGSPAMGQSSYPAASAMGQSSYPAASAMGASAMGAPSMGAPSMGAPSMGAPSMGASPMTGTAGYR